MARPIWHDAGSEPAAIAVALQQMADTAGALTFEPRQVDDRRPLQRAAVLRAKTQLTSAHGESDRIVAQEVRAIDDLVRTANLLVERLREWYALHAPEAVRKADPKQLASLVAEHGERKAVLEALELTETSLGSELDPADLAVLQGFAAALRAVHDSWEGLEKRVQDSMEELAPNLTSVVGPVLGARLLAQAGNLQRLAGFPSGTIQTLGAETALFRHIKEGTLPPKHGTLFQHPKVHQAQNWQRGAIARSLALHAALAAKADAYTQNDLREYLAEGLASDLARIAKDKATPPKHLDARGFSRGPPRGAPRGNSYSKPSSGGYSKPSGGSYSKPSGGGYNKPSGGSSYSKPSGGGYNKPSGSSYSKPSGGGFGARPGQGNKDPYADDDRKPYGKPSGGYGKPSGDRKPYGQSSGDRKPYGKPSGDRKPYGKPSGDRKPYGNSDRDDRRKKGPGAFRGDGSPAPPPGGKK